MLDAYVCFFAMSRYYWYFRIFLHRFIRLWQNIDISTSKDITNSIVVGMFLHQHLMLSWKMNQFQRYKGEYSYTKKKHTCTFEIVSLIFDIGNFWINFKSIFINLSLFIERNLVCNFTMHNNTDKYKIKHTMKKHKSIIKMLY